MIKRKKCVGVLNQRAILCTVNKLFYCFILFRFSAISFLSLSLSVNVEIAVVDTQSCGFDRFGEDKFHKERIFVIFDGIHYDPLIPEPLEQGQFIQIVFPIATSDAAVLVQAMEIASEAKASRQYKEVPNFSIRCLVCQDKLRLRHMLRLPVISTLGWYDITALKEDKLSCITMGLPDTRPVNSFSRGQTDRDQVYSRQIKAN